MKPYAKFAGSVVLLGAVISFVMIAALWRSSSLGVTFAPAENGWRIDRVVQEAIASGSEPGMTVTAVGGVAVLPTDLQHDFDQIAEGETLRHYFRTNTALAEGLRKGEPVALSVGEGSERSVLTVTPGVYPMGYFLKKEGALLFAALFCFVIAWLVLRKKQEDIAVSLLALLLSTTAVVFVSFAVWSSRLGGMDLFSSYVAIIANTVSFNLFPLLFLHFFLLFPTPFPWALRRGFVWMLYLLPLPLIVLFELRIFYEAQMLIFAAGVFGGIAAIVYRYVSTGDVLVRIQLRWIVFATLIFTFVMFLTQILPPLGISEAYSYQLPALAFCLIPLSIVVAILRYKLMQIDSLIDAALLYLVLLGLLGALDTGVFWLLASSAFTDLSQLPAFLVALWFSLLLYRPLRDRLIVVIERMLGRSRYSAESVAGGLVKSLLEAGTDADVEAATAQTLERTLYTETITFCYGEADAGCAALPFDVARWHSLPAPRYLYELESSLPPAYQTGVAVPMLVGHERIGVMVLARKKNRQLYSARDMALLELIASQAALAIAAVRARRESYYQESRARSDREAMLREVHDGIGGIATNINLLAQMYKESPSETQLRETLGTIGALSSEALAETRQLISSLDMSGMQWEQITAELRRFARTILQPHGIAFRMDSKLDAAVAPAGIVIFTLLRICREALTNIVKHAGASKVEMAFSVDGETIRLSVCDDGNGFDPRQRSQGHGLLSMRKRAQLVAGTLQIDSDEGTTVTLTLPVEGNRGNAL